MDEVYRLAVRQLVEFSIHGEDIRTGMANPMDMLEGMRGHKARQSMHGEGWQSEVPLLYHINLMGIEFSIGGRMDGFFDAEPPDIPIIEEIKLLPDKFMVPACAHPPHLAQAICYGHMLCAQRANLTKIAIRVAYVTSKGKIRALFEEEMSADQLKDAFFDLLMPIALWENKLKDHRAARNESIRALPFPFQTYRKGQREMAVQVYTAIQRQRRLYASMPTGTGKSAAVLFPALKALGEGYTNQIFYLTARTTARQGALEAIAKMREKKLFVFAMTLTAKDKVCPAPTQCHPDFCPRAKGHFVRLPEAIDDILKTDDWTTPKITQIADKHCICPFEFALSLTECADIVICDYNYAFDPGVHLKRIFDFRSDLTLLIDEAHNLGDRVREMLSGDLDGVFLREYRKLLGKAKMRKSDLYKALTNVINIIRNIELLENQKEAQLYVMPEGLLEKINILSKEAQGAFGLEQSTMGEAGGQPLFEVFMMALNFTNAAQRPRDGFALLCTKQGKERKLRLYCLSVREHIENTTQYLRGTVFFSATLSPLESMRELLGGNQDDGCFALPSPFPIENLLVSRRPVNTKYHSREETAPIVSQNIYNAFCAKPGKYIAFFPSYAYLRLVHSALLEIDAHMPVMQQKGDMTEGDREWFLGQFAEDKKPLLGMAVLGGIFAEGIDLPGEKLLGVMIIGVGFPMICLENEALCEYYNKTNQRGFEFAYQFPGMHKVLQAAGRVIRSPEDKGIVLLIDNRYYQQSYVDLCPPHWRFEQKEIASFWDD